MSARAGSGGVAEDAWDGIETGLARRRRRRTAAGFLAAGVAVVLLAVSTVWLWTAFRAPSGQGPGSETEPRLNPRVSGTIQVGESPAGISVGEGAVWVADRGRDCRGQVARIDPATNEVAARIPVSGWPDDVAVGFGSVWVEGVVCTKDDGDAPAVIRIDPVTNEVAAVIEIESLSADIAIGEEGVWVTVSGNGQDSGHVILIDPESHDVAARVQVEGDPRDVVVGEGSVWVLSRPPGSMHPEVLQIDPENHEVVATFPDALSVGIGEGYLWMSVWLTENDPGMVRVDPATGARDATVTGDLRGFAGEHGTLGTLVVGHGGVWLWGFPHPRAERGEIYRLNAATLEIDASVAPDGRWIDAALDPAGETLWLSNYNDSVTRIDLR